MKRLKVLVLLALAVIATMASAGSATATILTSPAGTPFTGDFHAASEGHLRIPTDISAIECNWTLKAEVRGHGTERPVEALVEELFVTGCTNEWTAKVTNLGELKITPLLGGPDGTVTWLGATVTFTGWGTFGTHTCNFTIVADVGRITGSTTTGSTATIDVLGELTRESGSYLCRDKPTISGSLKVESPDFLDVDGPDTFHALSEGKITIHNEAGWKSECDWTFESEVKADGSNITDGGGITNPVISGCGEGNSAIVTTPGSLKIHPIGGGPDGTVTWSGAAFTVVKGGISCTYQTSNTHIGRLTGSTTTGKTATLDLSGSLPVKANFLCGKTGQLTGSLTVTTPDVLNVTS